ncbi:MAG: cytochrome c [Novosphingobium sp.]
MRLKIRFTRLTGVALAGVAVVAVSAGTALSAGETAPLAQAPAQAPAVAAAVPVDVSKLSKDEIDTLIYERQQVMQQLQDDAELLGEIVAGLAPKEKLAETTAAIARSARETHAAFNLKLPGGRTKPEAWSNWADYSRRLDAFVASTSKLEELGKTGSVPAVNDILGDAMPCKACHDLYREPKKPAAGA